MTSTTPRKGLFCSKPFSYLEVANHPVRGDLFVCCPGWLPVSLGNLATQSVSELWNGPRARQIRASVFDGSFRYCNEHCPYLHTITGPVQRLEDIVDPKMLDIIAHKREELPFGPSVVNAAFDRSCNLSCPSCRVEHVIETEAASDIVALQKSIERDALKDASTLYVTGSGDPFGSPYFFRWLRSIDLEAFPLVKLHLHTNAILWTEQRWLKLPSNVRERVESCEISIDAARSTTYSINRRGGDWEVLLQNLEFVSRLRRNGPLRTMKFHMVVQENNFAEMPEFVELGRRFGADIVYFSHLVDWGTFEHGEIERRLVHLTTHPRHCELLRVLGDCRLRDPAVDLGNLLPLAPYPPDRPTSTIHDVGF